MLKKGSYTPRGVCSRKIEYIIEDGIVKELH
ncbi:MAG: TSCPD domain-containing protein, partial [Clostridia bacterium]